MHGVQTHLLLLAMKCTLPDKETPSTAKELFLELFLLIFSEELYLITVQCTNLK